MIVTRYFRNEVYTSMIVVTGVLMLIFLSNQFVRYLSRAALGKMSGAIVMKIMALQIPYLLGLLLPIGLFIGILLAYGRLYVDSEMTVFSACGLSRGFLLRITQWFALPVMLVVGGITLYVTPHLMEYAARLKTMSKAQMAMDTMMPGRFQVSPDGRQVIYIENITRDRQKVENIFIASQKEKQWDITSAKEGYSTVNEATGDSFVVAVNGYRYQGTPGEKNYRMMSFGKYGLRIDNQDIAIRETYEAMSNKTLLSRLPSDNHAWAELQWRLVMPLSVPVLVLLAVPLSYVQPRQGRYAKLLPALLLYTAYANLMFVARDWVEDGVVNHYIGLWWLPALLVVIALLLIRPIFWQRFIKRHSS